MQETKEPIRDEELNINAQKAFHENIEEQLAETEMGQKILLCQRMGIKGISFKNFVEAYKSSEGYSFSKEGVMTLDEDALMKVAEPTCKIASDYLNVDIEKYSLINLKGIISLRKNLTDEEYAKVVDEEGVVHESIAQQMAEKYRENEKEEILNKKNDKDDLKSFNDKPIFGVNMNKMHSYMEENKVLSEESMNKTITSTFENIDNSKLSYDLKMKLFDTMKVVQNFDMDEIQLIRLVREQKYLSGFELEAQQRKIKDFLAKNPSMQGMYDEMTKSPDGNLPQEYIDKINRYEANLSKVSAISAASRVLGKGLENLTQKEKDDQMLLILAGAMEPTNNIEKNKQLIEVFKMLKPEANLKGENGEESLANLKNDKNFLKELGSLTGQEVTPENFENVLKLVRLRTVDKTDLKKIKIKDFVKFAFEKPILFKNAKISFTRRIGRFILDKISNKEMEQMFDEKSEIMNVSASEILKESKKSKNEKYFETSKLEFTEKDKEAMTSLYNDSTYKCWIGSQEKYVNLKFASLMKMKEDLENKPNRNKLEDERLIKTNQRLEKFSKKYSEYNCNQLKDSNTGNLKETARQEFCEFESLKVKSKLTNTFLDDMENVNNFNDYDTLSKKDKKDYLRNTIVALQYIDKSEGDNITKEDILLAKFGQRRLEIINNKNSNFIKFEDGNKALINKDKILEEYNKYSKQNFKSYEELQAYCESNKAMYVSEKLDEYDKLKPEDFIEAQGNSIDEKIQHIQKMKFNINARDVSIYSASHTEENTNIFLGKKKSYEIEEEHRKDDENSNLPVEKKEKGFFGTIVDKVKGFFAKKSDNSELQNNNSNENTQEDYFSGNVFNERYHYDADIKQALNSNKEEINATLRETAAKEDSERDE